MQLSAIGDITTVAGDGLAGYSGDGGPAVSASLSYPNGIAFDASGDIYIADTSSSAIRKIIKDTSYISTVAGTPMNYSYSGDCALSVLSGTNFPSSIAVDVSGNIYIADTDNHII